MKKTKVIKLLLIPIMLICLLFSACKNGNNENGLVELKLNTQKVELYVGDDYVLRSTCSNTEWMSQDATIAQIDARGRVRALSMGETIITASANGKTLECVITVSEKQTFSTETVVFEKTQEVFVINGSYPLKAKVYINGEETQNIPTYSSDNEQVATVVDGVVTTKTAGKAQIKATYGSATATCTIYVFEEEPSLILDQHSVEIEVDETATLTGSFQRDGVSQETAFTWTTNNDCVTVSNNGEICGVLPGESIVTVSVQGLIAYCHVKVVRVQEIESVDAFLSIKDNPYVRYELMNDLDFSNYKWTEKTIVPKLSSTLDGNGNKLLHLTRELASDRLGVFGEITETGAVNNLAVYVDEMLYTDNCGALALYNYGTIQNCYIKVKATPKTTSNEALLRNGVVYENYGTMQKLLVDLEITTQNDKRVTFHAFAAKNFSIIKDCIVISSAVATRDVKTGDISVKNIYYQLLSGTSDVSHYNGYGYASVGVADNAQDKRRENCYIFEDSQQMLSLGEGGYAIDGGKGMVPETEKASLQITGKDIFECYDSSIWSFGNERIVFFDNILYTV